MCREIASNEPLNKVYVHIVSYQINYSYVSYYTSFKRHFQTFKCTMCFILVSLIIENIPY